MLSISHLESVHQISVSPSIRWVTHTHTDIHSSCLMKGLCYHGRNHCCMCIWIYYNMSLLSKSHKSRTDVDYYPYNTV